jgi:hypothetical protein
MQAQQMKVYEIYTFIDRQERIGRQGHVAFICGENETDAWHNAAKSIPRIWQNCGIRETTVDSVRKRLQFLNFELKECSDILGILDKV